MKKKKIKKTLSNHFNLNKKQYELDFFNCFIDFDTLLFIDPWALLGNDKFSTTAHKKVQSFFSRLLYLVKRKEKEEALELLNNLHEPRETGLGYSTNGKSGGAVGFEKAEEIYNNLAKSKAVKTGLLSDLEDTALHIERIGRDTISDIVTNIIRYELVKYTQEQCNLYGIEMHKSPTGFYWDDISEDFIQSNEEDTLSVDGQKILLVPKKILRRQLSLNYNDFYNKGIVEFERSRHLDLRTSLCRTLKDKSKAKPYIKTIKEDPRYKLSRELIFKYIDEEPSILDSYKKKLILEKTNFPSNNEILKKQGKSNDIEKEAKKKILTFSTISKGKKDADVYHNHIFDCLNFIFNEPGSTNYLSGGKKELKMNEGRKRVDISFYNESTTGFFSRLSNYANLTCANIFFECKNYTNDVNNPEYDQMIGRFNNRTSTIGFIVCRNISDKARSVTICKDIVSNGRGYVLVLTDEDIIELLKSTFSEERDLEINSFLNLKMKKVIIN